MKLIVDANILVSFFRDNPVRSIIINSGFLGLQLFSPEYALEELKRNIQGIMKYSKLSSEQVEFIIREGLKKFIALCLAKEIKLWTYEPLLFDIGLGVSTKQISDKLSNM